MDKATVMTLLELMDDEMIFEWSTAYAPTPAPALQSCMRLFGATWNRSTRVSPCGKTRTHTRQPRAAALLPSQVQWP